MQFQPDADGHIFLLHRDEIETLVKKAGLLIPKSLVNLSDSKIYNLDFLVKSKQHIPPEKAELSRVD